MRSKLSFTVYLFLALYGSTTIQSRWFLKNVENFVQFPKQYLLGVFILEKQLANIPDRGFLFLRNTLLLYSLSPHSQTDGWTEEWIKPGCAGHPDGFLQINEFILVGLATLTGSSRFILVGLATLTGSSRLILVVLGNPGRFLQV